MGDLFLKNERKDSKTINLYRILGHFLFDVQGKSGSDSRGQAKDNQELVETDCEFR